MPDNGPIKVIYGGEHQSVPPLGKVMVGDMVYPVRINGGALYLLGRFEISAIDDVELYLASQQIEIPAGHLWDTGSEILIKEKPALGHLIPRNCVNHAAIGAGTALVYDRIVPVSIVEKLKLGPKGKEKLLPLKEGKVSHVNFQGHFRRLSEESAEMVGGLI
ncbi:hypothetical protein D0T87_01930 [Bacteroides sp. 51]|nr:hypothetical protein [Bacteroides sp. 51]